MESVRGARIILFLLIGSGCLNAQTGAPVRLTVEDQVRPVGVGVSRPQFGWQSEGGRQTAFQILVASSASKLNLESADRWNSGKVSSGSVSYHEYKGLSLTSKEVVFWKVRIWNDTHEPSPWSNVETFEMGLLGNDDWRAEWIWRDSQEPDDYSYFRKTFPLSDKKIARARAYITAAHRFEMYVNGAPVGKGPNFAYPDGQYYRTISLDDKLRRAETNVLSFLCHWYGAGQGRPRSQRGLLVQVMVDYQDGTSAVVLSDSTWKTRRGEWLSDSGFRNGEGVPREWIDGRRHPVGWRSAEYNDDVWENAVSLGVHPTAPWLGALRAQETTVSEYEVNPVSIVNLDGDRCVADFGKVYAGTPKIHFSGLVSGSNIEIVTGYRLAPDGSVVRRAQSTDMSWKYIARGGDETFRPYWYLGGRYVEAAGCGRIAAGGMKIIARHHTVDWSKSTFASSDEMLNAVWGMSKRSLMFGSQEQFVDTPTREQAQFAYDAYLIGLGAMRAFGERDLNQQALQELAESQDRFYSDSGRINAVYPNGDGPRDIPDWTYSWILWSWDYWMETGDARLLSELFGRIVKAGEWVRSTENPDTGLIDLGNSPGYQSGIVDWPDRYLYDMETTQRTVLSVSAWMCYQVIQRLGDVLHEQAVSERFEDYANSIAAAINRHLWDPEQRAYVDGLFDDERATDRTSQQANAIVVASGLAPGERRNHALNAVLKAGFATSPLLSRFVLRAYGETGEDQALYDYLTNPLGGRNWAFAISDGATFAYEGWEGRRRKSEDSESHALTAYPPIMAVQEYVLGVTPMAAQFERVRIRPRIGSLTFAEGIVPTQRGEIRVSWKRSTEGLFQINVDLPHSITAEIHLPKGTNHNRTVRINGTWREGDQGGDSIVVENVGGGHHELLRQMNAPTAP